MRFGCAPLVVLVTACYGPSVNPGSPCGPNGECPSGLECISGLCLPSGSTPHDDAAMPDDSAVEIDGNIVLADAAPDGALPYVPWGTPVAVPSLDAVSGHGEGDPSITANKLTVLLTSDSPDDIFECNRTAIGQAFTCFVLAINSVDDDKSPEVSADGTTLYFSSDRGGSFDIYISKKTMGVWSTPVVATDLSSATTDSDLAISPDGLTAVVEQDPGTNHFVFFTRASTAVPFGSPVTHTELEGPIDIAAPSLTNNGDILYFHAGNTRDIYVATRKPNGQYNMPKPVTELNTSSRDAAPFVSADDKYMLFERAGDIYETTRP
ncbi:MAG TPA: hypothetical protein VFV99_13680 [Kofleriaceae bacterium]|nr:hypothetical protein [Kofleriaceae bacterium]